MNTFRSVIEKMQCIKKTTDNILNAINSQHKKTSLFGLQQKQPEALTSDDLLPILAYVIVQARVPHLLANIDFINNFKIDEVSSSVLG